MKNHTNLEQEIEKKFSTKDKKKAHKMKVSGKSVIGLKKVIISKSQENKKLNCLNILIF